MPINLRSLASLKGFALLPGPHARTYRLNDATTHLPELNPANGTFLFSIAEAEAFLRPLHDRTLSTA